MRNTENEDDRNDPPRSDIDDFFGVFDRLPFLGTLKKDIEELRSLLYDRRAPRLMVIGAPASGRTSLANALLRMSALPLGEAELSSRDRWIRIDAHGRYLDWLEIDSGPLEGGRKAAVRTALDETMPDLILVVVSATGIDDELADARTTLNAVLGAIDQARTKKKPPILGAVLRVDALLDHDRSRKDEHFDHASFGKVEVVSEELEKMLSEFESERRRRVTAVIAGGGDSPDLHWHMAQLAGEIHSHLPTVAKVESARALAVPHDVRRELAKSIVNRCSAAAVSIGLMPLPFADAFLLLPLQGVMVTSVAYLAGQPWDGRAGAEWLGSVGVMGGSAYALRFGAQQLAKVVPGWGSLISGGVAGGGTLAMGRSAIAYFVDGPGQREPRAELPANASGSEPSGSESSGSESGASEPSGSESSASEPSASEPSGKANGSGTDSE